MPLRNCRWSLFPLSLVFFLSLTSSAEEHSAPMEMRRDMPFVQVTINGQGPFTFGIDTGTGGQALVTPELIQKLKLTTVGESEVGDPSGRNSHKVPLVQIGSLTVAGVEFKNVKATQHTPSQREGPVRRNPGLRSLSRLPVHARLPQARIEAGQRNTQA